MRSRTQAQGGLVLLDEPCDGVCIAAPAQRSRSTDTAATARTRGVSRSGGGRWGGRADRGEQLQLLLLLWLRQQRRRGRAGCLRHGTERLGEADRGETVRRCSGRCWCVGTLGGLRREGCARGCLVLACFAHVLLVWGRPGDMVSEARWGREKAWDWCTCPAFQPLLLPLLLRSPPFQQCLARRSAQATRVSVLLAIERSACQEGTLNALDRSRRDARARARRTRLPCSPRLPRGGAVPCCPDPPLRGGIDRPAAVSGDRCAGCAGSAHGGGGRALPAVGMWEHGRPLPAWLPGWVSRPSSRSVQTQLRHAVWCCRA